MKTNRKYEIIDSRNWNGKTIRKIQALRSFGNVVKGQVGGWIESEDNLSHDGNCWINLDCVVCGDSKVTGDIVVSDLARFLYTVDQETLAIKPLVKRGWEINYSGFDKKSGEHYIRVGCQYHPITTWKNNQFRARMVYDYNLSKQEEQEFLEILEGYEKKYCQKDPLEKIEENVESMKNKVTEELKTETISLINSLQVSPVVSKGPTRDKFGRFAKKTP